MNAEYAARVRHATSLGSLQRSQDTVGEDWFTFPLTYSHFARAIREGGTFVEVGSWKGRSTVYMAHELRSLGKHIEFFCVDTWEGSPENVDDPWVRGGSLFDLFQSNTSDYADLITPLRKPSVEAARDFADASIDIVFIDACHEYESVKADIAAWLPKVRPGGIIAGHDYLWRGDNPVKKAVQEAFDAANVLVHHGENVWIVMT